MSADRIAASAAARPLIKRVILPYRPGEGQRCPSCDGRNWYVGRTGATCGFCDTDLPLSQDGSEP